MTAKSMDVFSLRDTVVGEYKKFATSFTTIQAEDIRRQVDEIYAKERYWPDPLIQINPNYRWAGTVEQLVTASSLHPTCDRRFLLRAELDTAFFHLYGLSHDDTDYILDTFPIVRKNEENHREYRTKRVILEIYDAMAEATRTGEPYQTHLDPPPADPRVAHPPRPEGSGPEGDP